MMKHRQAIRPAILALVLALGALRSAGAQPDTSTRIFHPLARTLTVTVADDLMRPAVLTPADADRLTFSFDIIGDDRRYLRCRLLHCDADWRPSRLVESEYVDGFNEAEIGNYAFSSNTYVHYVNYRFTIADDGLRPLVSGNYLWQVYDESDPDDILLQARFRVAEQSVGIGGYADGRTSRGVNTGFQQLRLEVNVANAGVPNPYTDLIVEVTRNDRPDTRRLIMHPQRVEGTKVVYDYDPALIFAAGNEYRRFETVRVNYEGMHIAEAGFDGRMHYALVATDSERASHPYIYDSTQRGRYKIDEYNATDPDLGADYVLTAFTLDYPEIMDGDVYVEGDLALRGYTDLNRMKYDRDSGAYTLTLPLKQGSYNYQYAVLPKEGGSAGLAAPAADDALIEGNHYETVNEYNVYVYQRTPGARYDRLLGAATIVSGR